MRLLVVFLLGLAASGQVQYDLVLQGARVIDPKNDLDGPRDVAVKDGKIAAVAERIDPSTAKKLIDVSGLVVTPGLVDMHTHLYYSSGIPDAWAGDNSIAPDSFSFRTGVTTMVDAGSAGWRNFEAFRTTVIDRAQTRVFAFINIAGLGMVSNMVEQGDFNPEAVSQLARKHSDVVVGVKAAHYEKPGWNSVDQAVAAGALAGIPVMVDFGWFLPERPYSELVTKHLRPGDISTHAFRGPVPWIDENGKLYAYLGQARERGVVFDVGHGGGSFVFRNAAPATRQGFYPDTISTDLHAGSRNSAMMDMPTTMSKFLAMGMPLAEVVRASTWRPAQVIRHEEVGHLTVGAPADIAIWQLAEGDFGFRDPYGGRLSGKLRFLCEMTLQAGSVVWDWNARSAVDYRELDPEYGVGAHESINRP